MPKREMNNLMKNMRNPKRKEKKDKNLQIRKEH